jgi:hypothetical protein
MSVEAVSANTEFDIFPTKPVQTSTLETTEAACNLRASIDQSDLVFLIPADCVTYIDLNIHLYIHGKLTKADGTNLDATDYTAVTKNFLHSIFSQCSIALNGVTITPAAELYHYRAYLEILLTYGRDAATSHLTNTFWCLDNGNTLACDPHSDLYG